MSVVVIILGVRADNMEESEDRGRRPERASGGNFIGDLALGILESHGNRRGVQEIVYNRTRPWSIRIIA